MTCKSLGRLELFWKALNLPPPLLPRCLSVCRLHSQRHGTHQLSRNGRDITFNSSLCRRLSNIVHSPYGDMEIPDKFIPEMIWDTVDRFPQSVAVKCGVSGRAYTYAEVLKLSQRFASSLRRAGFARGEVIAVVLPNCPEFIIVTLGALEVELTLSFINHSYTADEMCHQLINSGSVCIVSAVEKLDAVLSSVSKIEASTKSKPFRRIIALDIPSPESLPRGVSRYSEMVGDGIDTSQKSNYSIQTSDLAFLPYSSGTTGLSKGVCLSHRNIVSNLFQISNVEGMQMLSPDKGQDNVLGLLPFYHIYGLTVILLNSMRSGSKIITLPKFEQDSFIRTMENEKLSVMMLVPPLILFIGSNASISSKHLSNARFMMSGAAPLGASDLEKVKAKLPPQNNCYISQGYGLTETSPVVTMPKPPPKDMATVGCPVSNTVAKIINPDTGEALGPNQVGELCFKGPQVMLGYHNNPKATADMIDADRWLRTGDIGFYDEEGYFYIQDRLKELIKVKGLQVPPAELEELLRTHPLVSDVGVIGVPCPRAGEVPVAYIVPQKGKKVMAEDIKEFLSERVSKHKQVSEVIFTDSIPKSAAGKILRKDLRALYKASH